MQDKIQEKASDYLNRNHRRHRWKKVVSILAGIVVFCTTYALILPALTMEKHTAYCGLGEHTHGPECYGKALICGQAESESATDITTDTSGGSDSTEAQTTAKESEFLPVHTHTDECYEAVLTCADAEHSHVLQCYSDPEADLESPEDWADSVSSVELSGKWQNDLPRVAESQLGYTESDKNYAVDEDGTTKKGYTRYGARYEDPYGDWNAMFVSFCLDYTEIPEEAFPRESSCRRWMELLQDEKYGFYRARADYAPKAGDLIFSDSDGDGIADRVGIVVQPAQTPGAKLRSIEGDADGCVRYSELLPDDACILGYGELPGEPRVEYVWSQDGLEVVASVRQSADLPENAALVVEPISPGDKDGAYEDRYAASQEKLAAEASAQITRFELFRVYLEADGSEVLPGEEATVEIRLQGDAAKLPPHAQLFSYLPNGAENVALEPNGESGSLTGSLDAALSGEYAIVATQELSDAPQVLAAEATDPTTPDAATQKEESILTPHKYIDAFRDGADNLDTTLDNNATDKTDLYRLYLDAELSAVNKPIDLLIVVDQSGSMHNDYQTEVPLEDRQDMTKENNEAAYRDEALRLVLNGTSSAKPDDKDVPDDYEANKQNGLISQFLAANPENQVAVVGFQGAGYVSTTNFWGSSEFEYRYGTAHEYQTTADGKELADVTKGKIQKKTGDIEINVSSGIADEYGYLEAETLLDWTSDAAFVNVQGLFYNATNYTAGFTQAQKVLDEPKADNNHQKVILFLSDGAPTCHIEKERVNVGSSWRPQYEEIYFRDGNGFNGDGDQNGNKNTTAIATDTAFADFINANPGVILHTVSIKAGDAEDRLSKMATAGNGDCFSVSTTEALEKDLKQLMFGAVYSKLTIEDKLSRYVDIYAGQPDYKVTREETDGSVTVLYENGAITEAGNGVLKSVNYDSANKKVTAQFEPTYTPKPGTTVTLSFNVQTNQTAYEEYAKNQNSYYDTTLQKYTTGDTDTDYSGNATSSALPGFRSNSLAQVTYQKNDDTPDKRLEYPHPVVQVAACRIAIQKTDVTDASKTLPGAEFDLYRPAFTGETGEAVDGLSGSYVKVAGPLTTDESGQIIVDGLIPGDYCLVETKSPPGYKKLDAPVTFTLSRKSDGSGQIVGSDLTVTVGAETLPALRVTNLPWGKELPNTGGGGSTSYIMGGILLISAAILLLYTRKRRKEDLTFS